MRKELCNIEIGNEEHKTIQQELWTDAIGFAGKEMGLKCNKCRGGPEGDDQKLMFCSACKQVQYCSKACQKSDWKDHKIVCMQKSTASSQGGSVTDGLSRLMDAREYYFNVAPTTSEAEALAHEIGLTLPPTSRWNQVSHPMLAAGIYWARIND